MAYHPAGNFVHKILSVRTLSPSLFVSLCALIGVPAAQDGSRTDEPPKVQLLAPTGAFSVGTRVFHWTDTSRPMLAGEGSREIMVQLWYPARKTQEAEPAPYLTEIKQLSPVLPEKIIDGYRSVRTNSWLELPFAETEEDFPVIVFSHGLGMRRTNYSNFAEELASHGFVVAGIDHPFGAGAVAFPDGRVIKQDPLWHEIEPPEYSILERLRFTEERTEIWAADAGFVLDRLEQLNDTREFSGKLNLDQVGIFGHSVGGKAAVVACMFDVRFDACLDLDGWPIHSHAEINGLNQPFMYLEDLRDVTAQELESWKATIDEYERNMRDLQRRKTRLLEAMNSTSYYVLIRGIRHMYFSDIPSIDPDAIESDANLDPQEALEVIRKYMVAFFTEHLYGKKTDLLHPRATIRIYGANQYLHQKN